MHGTPGPGPFPTVPTLATLTQAPQVRLGLGAGKNMIQFLNF
jgi:hypothetical protein